MGKNLADLQSNISISANNAVTGDIEWCSGYTQFSTDIGEQAGWYLALQVTPDIEDATVTAAYNGTIRELDNNIFIIRLADGEDTITFTAEKEGYTTGRLTLDLSGLNKETITNYCYVTSLTNGVTVTPLQFGESKILSGVVPYDTTTSSNHFRLKYRTFIPIPAGSQISVSHFGTELGASTFNTVTPQEGEPYSEAEVEITITQEILDSQSPGLSTLIIPDTGEVLDRFYCSLGVENLTLAPDPRTKMNITTDIAGVTITPSTYSSTKTATGVVPYTNYYRLQLYPTITNAPVTDLYSIIIYDKDNNVAINLSGMTNLTTISTNGIAIDMSYSPSYMGTGAFFKIVLGSKTTADADYTTLDTVILDVSALTLGPAPITDVAETTGATYNNVTKTAAQLYNTTAKTTVEGYTQGYDPYLIIPENGSSTEVKSFTPVAGYPSCKWNFIPEWLKTPMTNDEVYIALTINPYHSEVYQTQVTSIQLTTNTPVVTIYYASNSSATTPNFTYQVNTEYMNCSKGDTLVLPTTILLRFYNRPEASNFIKGGADLNFSFYANADYYKNTFVHVYLNNSDDDPRSSWTEDQRKPYVVTNSSVLYNGIPITNYQTLSMTTSLNTFNVSGTLQQDGNGEYALYLSTSNKAETKPIQYFESSDPTDIITEITNDVTGSSRRVFKIQSATPATTGPSTRIYLNTPGTDQYRSATWTIKNNTTLTSP